MTEPAQQSLPFTEPAQTPPPVAWTRSVAHWWRGEHLRPVEVVRDTQERL